MTPGSTSPALPALLPRRPGVGYAVYFIAALLFALNGSVAKTLLLSGIEPARLSQLRISAAFLILLVFVAMTNRSALRLRRTEIPLLLGYGLLGVAGTQFLYFFAISRMNIGIALLIEFTAPILVALWFRFGRKQRLGAGVWLGMVLALVGLGLVAQVWQGSTLALSGVVAAAGAAVALAIYYILGERGVRSENPRDPVSMTMWAFGCATFAWAIAMPWWTFPWQVLTGDSSPFTGIDVTLPKPLLLVYMVSLGTVVAFWLSLTAMRNISAAQASTVGMAEPVIAGTVAWILLGETLTPVQLAGGALVLVAIFLAERARAT